MLVAIGALIGLWLFARELRRSALSAGAFDAAIAGVIGGMAGAKLLWIAGRAREEASVGSDPEPRDGVPPLTVDGLASNK